MEKTALNISISYDYDLYIYICVCVCIITILGNKSVGRKKEISANPIRNHNSQEWKKDVEKQEIKLSEYGLVHTESYNLLK